jgi:hypothetical protein
MESIKVKLEEHYTYNCTEIYDFPENITDWLICPKCKLKPKIWEFDNGRMTACGCGENNYSHFSVHAESIMSIHVNKNGEVGTFYNCDELKNNWNHWAQTGEILFEKPRNDGRW